MVRDLCKVSSRQLVRGVTCPSAIFAGHTAKALSLRGDAGGVRMDPLFPMRFRAMRLSETPIVRGM